MIRSRASPCPIPAVAVDSRAYPTVGPECDRVFLPRVGGQLRAVAPLKLDELPRRSGEVNLRAARHALSKYCSRGDEGEKKEKRNQARCRATRIHDGLLR